MSALRERRWPAPSERALALVEPHVPAIIERAGVHSLLAIAITGSASRGEETWRGDRLAGDIDLVAVVRAPGPYVQARVEEAGRGLPAGVELACFPLYSLRSYRTLGLYEARECAEVVWGDRDIFQRVRIHRPSDIPAWEGVRLLLNRTVDCVAARAGIAYAGYVAVQVYLALGGADLATRGEYAPTYRARRERLRAAGAIFGSRDLLERFEWAAAVKLGESGNGSEPAAPPPAAYEADLLGSLGMLLGRYLGRVVTPAEGVRLVRHRMCHPAHRAMYLRRHWRKLRRWPSMLAGDPMLALWGDAVAVLEGRLALAPPALAELYHDFKATHQPLPR